jgi:vancomycin resistance protein YoaR
VGRGSDETALGALVGRGATARDRASQEPRLEAPARGATLDGKGTVSWRPRGASVRLVRAGRVGFAVDRDAAQTAIADAIRTGRHELRLPVKRAIPKVTPAQARRIDALIGTFTTRYEPGQPRVTNIRRMARTVDGTVIAPGAQFSLNGVVGQRTKAGGYVEAPFIGDDNKIVPSIGGGVSQFSTTMYNAAYFAGLRVDSHQPHSLYISRYPPGRESTLDFPGIDLKWTNDTEVPILVRTATDDTSVTVSLYGDNGGRRVTADPGPRTHPPGKDFEIRVVRTVRTPGGPSKQDAFTTTYDKGEH